MRPQGKPRPASCRLPAFQPLSRPTRFRPRYAHKKVWASLSRVSRNQAKPRQAKQMFHSRGLPRVLLFPWRRPKVPKGAAPPSDGALDRLLCRTEVELADPDAVRRRETMAQLKHVAALTVAEHT